MSNSEDEEATNSEVGYFLEEFIWVNPQLTPQVVQLLTIASYRLYDSDREQESLKECLSDAIIIASDLLEDLEMVIAMKEEK